MGLTPSRDQVGPRKINNSNSAGPLYFSGAPAGDRAWSRVARRDERLFQTAEKAGQGRSLGGGERADEVGLVLEELTHGGFDHPVTGFGEPDRDRPVRHRRW